MSKTGGRVDCFVVGVRWLGSVVGPALRVSY